MVEVVAAVEAVEAESELEETSVIQSSWVCLMKNLIRWNQIYELGQNFSYKLQKKFSISHQRSSQHMGDT